MGKGFEGKTGAAEIQDFPLDEFALRVRKRNFQVNFSLTFNRFAIAGSLLGKEEGSGSF